jgi:hypothetical protein
MLASQVALRDELLSSSADADFQCMNDHVPYRSTRLGQGHRFPSSVYFNQLDQCARDRSLRPGKLLEDRIGVEARQDAKCNRQPATLPRLGISRRLPLELRQFVASHKQPQARRVVAERAQRREGGDLVSIKVKLFDS